MDVEGEWDLADVGEVPVRSSAEEVLAGLHGALCCSRYCSLPHPTHAFGLLNCIMPTCTRHLLRACPHEVSGSEAAALQVLSGSLVGCLLHCVRPRPRTCLGASSAF